MLSAGALVMLPSVAWADGGCGSSFESWGCFKLLLVLLSIGAVPAFIVSAIVVLAVLNTVRKAPAWKQAVLVGLGLPLAYVNTYIAIALAEFGPQGPAFISAAVAVTVVLQLVALGVIGALWTRSPKASA